MDTHYNIYHNGGGPCFLVTIKDNKATIYKCGFGKFSFEFEFEDFFVGEDEDFGDFKKSKVSKENFDANTLLFKLSGEENSYMYVGCYIYQFTAYAKIVDFCVALGSGYSPYGYALDEQKNIYDLVCEEKVKQFMWKDKIEVELSDISYEDFNDDEKTGEEKPILNKKIIHDYVC